MTSFARLATPIDAHVYGEYRPSRSSVAFAAGRIGAKAWHADPGRYHVYGAASSAATHRIAVIRELHELTVVVSMSYVDSLRDGRGWASREESGRDPVNGFTLLRGAFEATAPGFAGDVTVPALGDRDRCQIVSTIGIEIGTDLATSFPSRAETYPWAMADGIEQFAKWLQLEFNPAKALHDPDAAERTRRVLKRVERTLGEQRYILGGRFTVKRRFGFVGVALLGFGLLGCMTAISYLGVGSTSAADWRFLAAAVGGLALIALFLLHAARAPAPFVSITFLAGRGWGVVNFINFFYGAAALGFGPLIPIYAEHRNGLKALGAGSLLAARSIGMVAVAGIATVARRTGTRRPIVVGYLVAAAGTFMVAIAPHGLSPYAWLSLAAAIAGIGMGVSTSASNNAGLQLAPGSAASAAGLRGMFRQAGSITGVAVISAVMARTSDPARVQAYGFAALALLMVLVVPLVRFVPEHRGSW